MPEVSVPAHAHQEISLEEWVSSLGPSFSSGSLRLEYDSLSFGLGAQVMLLNEAQSLSIDVPLRARSELFSTRLEGIWWIPTGDPEIRLAIANVSDSLVQTELTFSADDGATLKHLQVPLPPHHSRVLALRELIAREPNSFGGISITHDGRAGAIMAHGYVLRRTTGYSAAIPFTGPASSGSSSLHGAGVILGLSSGVGGAPGNFTGRLLVRNISTLSVNATPRLKQSGVEWNLGHLFLSPGEAREIQVPSSLVSSSDGAIGIEVTGDGQPGSLFGYWESVDQTGSLIVETPLRSPSPALPSSGSNPFSLAGETQSTLFIKNTGTTPASFIGVIYHALGNSTVGLRIVAAGETVEVDIRQLRDQQILDVNGNALPSDLQGGQFQWLRRSGPLLLGRVVVMNQRTLMASNMSCAWCYCSPRDVYLELDPDYSSAVVGDFVQETAWETSVDCDNTTHTYPLSPIEGNADWSSTDPFVASVNNAGGVFCNGPGTATIIAGKWVFVQTQITTECEQECPPENRSQEDEI